MCTCSEGMTRRQAIQAVAAAAAAFAAAGWVPLARAADDKSGGKARKVLFFTQSAGFEHSCIKRKSPDELSHAEKVLVEVGKKHGFDVTATKDGGVFTAENLAQYDLIAFYTTGDPTKPGGKDGSPPMPANGLDALMKFVESGKGFVGFHCATDTFGKHHGSGDGANTDAYIKMVGAEFDGHGKQQDAKIRAVPGFAPLAEVRDFTLLEEWYRFKNIAPDMQVILAQETSGMEKMYTERKAYPMTWARSQGKGRVFYTSMGHREDVWTNELFHQIFLAGMNWAAGDVKAEVKPNLQEACPGVENVRPG